MTGEREAGGPAGTHMQSLYESILDFVIYAFLMTLKYLKRKPDIKSGSIFCTLVFCCDVCQLFQFDVSDCQWDGCETYLESADLNQHRQSSIRSILTAFTVNIPGVSNPTYQGFCPQSRFDKACVVLQN